MLEETEKKESKGFDLQVTHRDEKTGLVTHTNPYTLRIVAAQDGGKMRLWERPIGSGNLWNKKNEPVGRWLVDEKTQKGKYVRDAAHTAFVPPETKDQKLAKSIISKEARIAELEKELAGVRAEAEGKSKKKQGS